MYIFVRFTVWNLLVLYCMLLFMHPYILYTLDVTRTLSTGFNSKNVMKCHLQNHLV
jgi:hypothetical protein